MVRWHYGPRTKVLLVLTPHFRGLRQRWNVARGKASGPKDARCTFFLAVHSYCQVRDSRLIVRGKPIRHHQSSRGPPLLNRLIPFISGGPRLIRHDPLRTKNVHDSSDDTPPDTRCFSRRHLARKLREPFDFLLPCWQANFYARSRLIFLARRKANDRIH